jgi:ubiquinone/menaquinone biosynthesis C-methylase UbiE
MKRKHEYIATVQRSFDEILEDLPRKEKWARAVLARVDRVVPLPENARMLDVGAASGSFVAACTRLGYRCEGIEPSERARAEAVRLGEHLGVPVHVTVGTAEAIPYEDGTFDLVHASNVIEHVTGVDRAFAEAYRVLKPGGVFWFTAASSMCPYQDEIRGFPLFGWYPGPLKRRIMNWAVKNRPHLVGHSEAPAVNWFTPRRARTLLEKQGFRRVYDRWDLRGGD